MVTEIPIIDPLRIYGHRDTDNKSIKELWVPLIDPSMNYSHRDTDKRSIKEL